MNRVLPILAAAALLATAAPAVSTASGISSLESDEIDMSFSLLTSEFYKKVDQQAVLDSARAEMTDFLVKSGVKDPKLAALHASDDPAAWGAFAEIARRLAASAKAANVTIALRTAPGTLCENAADLRRFKKDVDSAWLRFAPEPAMLGAPGDGEAVLAKSVIAFCPIEHLATFAAAGDVEAPAAVRALARFRGFVVLERREVEAPRDAYHHAIERFAALRASSLELRPA